MELDDYVRLLRRYWRSIALPVVVGALVGWALSTTATPVYSSSARVLFVGPDGPTTQFATLTYRDLVSTPRVLQPVADELDLGDGAPLGGRVVASGSTGSAIITITAEDADPQLAASISQGVAESLIAEAAEVEALASEEPITHGSVVAAAGVPSVPVSPDTRFYVVGGGFAGLLVGLGQALVRYWRSRGMRAP